MSPHTQPDLFPHGLPGSLAEATLVDGPPVLEARELTGDMEAAGDEATLLELTAVPIPDTPPLPLDALVPLDQGRSMDGTDPGMGNIEALSLTGLLPALVQVPEDAMSLSSRPPRERPATLTYGEMEAIASLGSGEGEEARILYEIPVPPRPARPLGSPRPKASLSPTAEQLNHVAARAQGARPEPPGPVDATRGRTGTPPSRRPLHTGPTRDLRVLGARDEDRCLDPSAIPAVTPREPGAGPDPRMAAPTEEDLPPDMGEDTPGEAHWSEPAGVRGPRFEWGGRWGLGPWVLGRASLLALLLLGEAVILPGYRDGHLVAPWTELLHPGSTSFTAAAFFLLLVATLGLPLDPGPRLAALGAVAVGLLLFAFLLMGSAVGMDLFDGQPALDALFRGGVALRVVLVICAVTLPTALLWRHHRPHSEGARMLVGTGLFLVAFSYLGLHKVGLGGQWPVGTLVDAGLGSLFLGDRLAAWGAFVPGLVALGALPLVLPRPSSRDLTLWAGLFWAAMMAPLFMLALFVASLGDWMAILEPIQVVSTLAAGLLLVPVVLSELLLVLGEGDVPSS